MQNVITKRDYLTRCTKIFTNMYIRFLSCFLDGRDTLRQWRDDNIRCSEEVIEIWQDVLSSNTHKVGDESMYKYFYTTLKHRIFVV